MESLKEKLEKIIGDEYHIEESEVQNTIALFNVKTKTTIGFSIHEDKFVLRPLYNEKMNQLFLKIPSEKRQTILENITRLWAPIIFDIVDIKPTEKILYQALFLYKLIPVSEFNQEVLCSQLEIIKDIMEKMKEGLENYLQN